jgi:hydroxymethylpyrimidine/phosphomethylpyrimidine kinase
VQGQTETSPPAVLAVGCFDSTGRTGLIRDYLTARALGSSAILVPTAIAIEGGDGVRLNVRDVAHLIDDVEAAMPLVGAIKIGLLGSPDFIVPLTRVLARFRGFVVYDPVLFDPGGNTLPEGDLDALSPLISHATLISPDVKDAARLTGMAVNDQEGARLAATHLRLRGAPAVLIKGVTMPSEAVDVLAQEEGEAHFSTPRRASPPVRGTGSAMATAIAVGMTRRLSIRGAVREAHQWLHARLGAAAESGSADWL